MGNKNSGKHIYKINEGFFKNWNPQMAYIFGFTCADGNIHQRTLAWDLSNKDISNFYLLKSFCVAMDSDSLVEKKAYSYRLRISNNSILNDIKKLGIIFNKSKTLKYPIIPNEYLSHFLRGFVDGDGWVITRIRKNGGKEICIGFCSGSFEFMNGIINSLHVALGIENFNLRKRDKITKSGKNSFWYQLEFYSENAYKILDFLYGSLGKEDLFLKRKYNKFVETRAFFKEEESFKFLGGKGYRLKKILKKDPEEIVRKLFFEDNLIPREIALKLGISLSTLYRWMDKHDIRKFTRRGSLEWSQRVIKSKKLIT